MAIFAPDERLLSSATLKLGGIDGVKFLAWKSGGLKFLTNSMSANTRSIFLTIHPLRAFSDKHYMFPPNRHLRLISSELSFNTEPRLNRGKKLEVCILNEFCPNWWFFVAAGQYHANLGQLWRNDNTRQTLSTTSWKWGNSKSSNVWNIYFGFLCCALSLQSFLVYATYYACCICAWGGFKKIQDRSKKWDPEPLIWASHAFLNSKYLCRCR